MCILSLVPLKMSIPWEHGKQTRTAERQVGFPFCSLKYPAQGAPVLFPCAEVRTFPSRPKVRILDVHSLEL